MIEIPEDKLREAYWYVLKNKTGFQDELDKIHPMMSLYLIEEGVIGEGMNSIAQLRYHLTELGEMIAKAYYFDLTQKMIHEYIEENFNL